MRSRDASSSSRKLGSRSCGHESRGMKNSLFLAGIEVDPEAALQVIRAFFDIFGLALTLASGGARSATDQ